MERENIQQSSQVVNIGNNSFVNCNNINIFSNVVNNFQPGVEPADTQATVTKQNSSLEMPLDELAEMMENTVRVTSPMLLNLHLNGEWEAVIRQLGLTDSQIDDLTETYLAAHRRSEAVHQCLRTWMESNGNKATIAELSKVLYQHKQMDALKTLAQNIEEMKESECKELC